MRQLIALLFAVTLLSAAFHSNATHNSGIEEYNKEQALLFIVRHLQNVTTPAVLHYDLRQYGVVGGRAEIQTSGERVTLEITAISEYGSKDAKVTFLPDQEDKFTSETKGTYSNPVVTAFLQWDVERMAKAGLATDDYFRHLIRYAFIDDSNSEETSVSYMGKQFKARKITLVPFAVYKNNLSVSSYVNKYYEFIVAASVPGGIYSITTILSGNSVKSRPKERVVLTFRQIDPGAAFTQRN